MRSKALGIVDSGLGGLLITYGLAYLEPDRPLFFYADQRRAPYGNKSSITVAEAMRQNLLFLKDRGAEELLIACNSGASALYKHPLSIGFHYHSPLEPTLKRIQSQISEMPYTLLATPMTVTISYYQNQIYNSSYKLSSLRSTKLASSIEASFGSITDDTKSILTSLCMPLKQSKNGILLGCTHYSWALEFLTNSFIDKRDLIDSSCCTIEQLTGCPYDDVFELLCKRPTCHPKGQKVVIFSSQSCDHYLILLKNLFSSRFILYQTETEHLVAYDKKETEEINQYRDELICSL